MDWDYGNMNFYFIASSDILKYLLVSFNPLKDNSIWVTSLNLRVPYLPYVLLLDPILLDKVVIDLVDLTVLATSNRGLLSQLVPLVYAHLEPTRLSLQVHRQQVLWLLTSGGYSDHEGAGAEDVTRWDLKEGWESGGAWEGVHQVRDV